MGAKELDVVITVIAVILVIMLWIMLYDSNRFVVRHYPLRDQRIKNTEKKMRDCCRRSMRSDRT